MHDAINEETKRRRVVVSSDFNKFLIGQKEVDLISNVSNETVGRVPVLTDFQAFGIRKKRELVTPKSVSQDASLSNVPVLEEIVPERISYRNSLSVRDNFFKILKSGRDPSEAFLESSFRSRIYTTKERMQGYTSKSQNILFDQTLEIAAKSLRAAFETNSQDISKIENESGNAERQIYQKDDSFSNFKSNDLIPIESREVAREKLVDVNFVISESKIPISRKFFLKAEIVDSNDLIQQTKTFLIDHNKKAAIFEMPRDQPSISVKNQRNGKYFIECHTSDQNINSIKVYAKTLNETIGGNSSFVEIADLSVKPSRNKVKASSSQKGGFVPAGCVEKKNRATSKEYSEKIISFYYNSSTLSPVLFRAVGVNKSGNPMSNFSSSNCSQFSYSPMHVCIFGRIMREGINISVSNMPPGVILVDFLRRDLTIHEREFSTVPIISDVATREATTSI